MNDVGERQKPIHRMDQLPTVTIDGAECELRIHGGMEPDDRACFEDVAKFLAKLDADQWDELHKLGAFENDTRQKDLTRLIDEIMRMLLRAFSERDWKGESGFSLEDVLTAATNVSAQASALRACQEEMVSVFGEHSRINERISACEALTGVCCQHVTWPPDGGTIIDAVKHTGELAKEAINSRSARRLIYGATGEIKVNTLQHTRDFLLSLYGGETPEAAPMLTLFELAQDATKFALDLVEKGVKEAFQVDPEGLIKLRVWLKNFVLEEDKAVVSSIPLEALVRNVVNRLELRNRELASQVTDNPEFDATPCAHPAWQRGSDHAVKMVCQGLGRTLTAPIAPPSFASEDMNYIAKAILELREAANVVKYALHDLRTTTVMADKKPDCLPDGLWDDMKSIYARLKSG